MWARNLIVLLVTVVIGLSSAVAKRTLDIPREQIDALPDMHEPQITPFDGSREGVLRQWEEIIGSDPRNTIADTVVTQIFGAIPYESHVKVVWQAQASGGWSETLSGEGTINVVDLSVLGIASGRQLISVLNTQARNWPFELAAYLSAEKPTYRLAFQEAIQPSSDKIGGIGFFAINNHLFQKERAISIIKPEAMRASASSLLSTHEVVDSFLYTEIEGGHIRVDTKDKVPYRILFTAHLTEHRWDEEDGSEPTGRSASISGWVCDAVLYEKDPDSCQYDEFHVVDYTPSHNRGNVNTDHPTLTVTFSDPVDLNSLADNFSLVTVDANGQPIEVDGVWREAPYVGAWRDAAAERAETVAMDIAMEFGELACSTKNTSGVASHSEPILATHADPYEYEFKVTAPLHSGTRYKARVKGGEDGVKMRHAQVYLDEDLEWEFSTLLKMVDHPIEDDDDQLKLYVFQTVRDPELVVDKPALTRIYPDWSKHSEIDPAWQPTEFEFELALTPHHSRIVGQRDRQARNNQTVWLESQEAFKPKESEQFSDEIRRALHTVNAFGWKPQQDTEEVKLAACPHAPFPHAQLASIETRQKPVEIWDHDPGRLNFFYVLANLGSWSDGLTFVPGERFATGIPIEDQRLIGAVLRRTEEYIPQFLPYRAGRAIPTGKRVSQYTLAQAADADPLAGKKVMEWFIPQPFDRLWSMRQSSDQVLLSKLARYIRLLQLEMRKQIGPDDFVVVIIPDDIYQGGTTGIALSHATNLRYQGLYLDYRSRAAVLMIPSQHTAQQVAELKRKHEEAKRRGEDSSFSYYPPYNADELAEALTHEFGHTLSLLHIPAEYKSIKESASLAEDAESYFEEGIEGYRLDRSGLSGWNKSFTEGNQEHPTALASLMWPVVLPSKKVWLPKWQYEDVQRDIKYGFRGAAQLSLADQPLVASRNSTLHTGASAAPVPQLIVSGLISPKGDGVWYSPLRIRSTSEQHRKGSHRAELVDDQGQVLSSAAFTPQESDLTSLLVDELALSPEDEDDPLLWPDFYVSLPQHPQAVALIISEGEQEIARIAPAGEPLSLSIEGDTPLQLGGDEALIRWRTDSSKQNVVFDVEYSPTGRAPWQLLSQGQRDTELLLDPSLLQLGPVAQLRVTARSGLHSDQQTVPLNISGAFKPISVELPEPDTALQDSTVTLQFNADLSSDDLAKYLQLRTAEGTNMPVELFYLPGQHIVSLQPLTPLAEQTQYEVHLSAQLRDIYDNELGEAYVWTFTTAERPPEYEQQ